MKGHLTIAKNNAFYNINNNLIKVNILGRNNKVVNPFRINDLYIHSDYNTIEVINGGKINYVTISGNNNKIYIKNNSYFKYRDSGKDNQIIKNVTNLNPFGELANPIIFVNNNNYIGNQVNHNNNNLSNRINNILNKFQEQLFWQLPPNLQYKNLYKCFLCNKTFKPTDKVKIFSCNEHIFHIECLKNYIRQNINSYKCPKCPNNNNMNFGMPPPYFQIYPPPPQIPQPPHFNQIGLRPIPLNNLNHSLSSNEADDIPNFEDDDEYFRDELDSLNENFDELDLRVLRIKKTNGLEQQIIDNMEIYKMKNVEKLDNDKKKCTICLENYVDGDDSIALPCIHIFHADCIKTWVKDHNTCPICKKDINYENEEVVNNFE